MLTYIGIYGNIRILRETYGVNSMYTFDEQTLSDLHKDARGSRPRSDLFWDTWNEADNDGKQAIWDGLVDEMVENDRQEAEHREFCVGEFKALVEKTIALGAGDRATALRWIAQHDRFEHEQDVEHFVWEHGILFCDYGKALVKELMEVLEINPGNPY